MTLSSLVAESEPDPSENDPRHDDLARYAYREVSGSSDIGAE